MQWNGPTDGVTNCTPFFNKLVLSMEGGGKADTVIEFPTGTFVFKTAPRALPQIHIRGQGMLSTTLIRRGTYGAFFQSNGSKGNGIVIEDLACWTEAEFSAFPANFIHFVGGSVFQPDAFVLRNLWISSGDGGLWENNIFLDGINRLSPQGLRIGTIENCHLFNARTAAIYARNCVGLLVRGTGTYPGAGAADGARIMIAGSPAVGITGASFTGLASVTTDRPHGIAVGAAFTLYGCTPSAWNGTYVAYAGTGGTQLNFLKSSNPGGMTVNGTIGVPVQVITASPHGLSALGAFTIAGFTPATWNGTFAAEIIVSASQVQFSVPVNPALPSVYGTLTKAGGSPIQVNVVGTQAAGYTPPAITGASWSALVSFVTAANHGVPVGGAFAVKDAEPVGWNGTYVAAVGSGANQLNAEVAMSNPGGMTVNGVVSNLSLNSVNCHFSDIILNSELNITNSSGSSFRGSMGSLATDDSSRWRIDGQCYGAVANNLLDSEVVLF